MNSFGVIFSVLISFPSKTNLSGLKCNISHFSFPLFAIWPENGFFSAGGACSNFAIIAVPRAALFLCFLPSKCALKVIGPKKDSVEKFRTSW